MKHQIRSQFDCKAKLAIWGTERPLKCVKEAVKSTPVSYWPQICEFYILHVKWQN